MEIYLVGGAVRDTLLGLPVHERDYCVVGATPEYFLEKGYTPVGKDFPVFLHPQTKEEYALARTERKVGPGYHGFTFQADPSVSLEEDLKRRDLTINAMAETLEGQLIDPYGGLLDLQAKQLRHVSSHFVEDPVRVLRLARFAARFSALGFHIASETKGLVETMIARKECSALVPERILKETLKAMQEEAPQVYFEVLYELKALDQIFEDCVLSWDIPAGIQTLACYRKKEQDPELRLTAFVLGAFWDHSKEYLQFFQKLPCSKRVQRLVELALSTQETLLETPPLTPEQILDLFYRWDVFRRPETLPILINLLACLEPRSIHSASLEALFARVQTVHPATVLANVSAAKKAEVLRMARLKVLKDIS